MGVKINDAKRLAMTLARAEAAVSRIEKIADLLEVQYPEAVGDSGGESQDISSERLDAQDGAIIELAEIIAELGV